ncbi:MAG: histidinol-phosphatase HisJ family protein [Kiritimatiellae bacterium]|nr:histidinol-phosphatase HisJ family protein [Kiritimatiellia bacterium]
MNRRKPIFCPPDTHIHTSLCKHATGQPMDYVEAARGLALTELSFADHAPAPDGYDPLCRMSLEEFPLYRDQVETARHSGEPPVILFGIEADYYEGCESFLAEWLPNQDFDVVLGSVHYIGNWGFDNSANVHVWKNVDVTSVWRTYFELLSRLVTSRLYDVVTHLDLPKKFGYRPRDNVVREMALPLLDLIAKTGMAIEINTGGLRKPVREIYPSAMLLALAREREIPICFGSDAHSPAEVAFHFDRALDLATEVGYSSMVRFRRRQRESTPLFVNM